MLDGVSVHTILWSDSFKFGFYSPAQKQNGYITLHGAIEGYESAKRMRRIRFQPDTAFDSLRELRPKLDKQLLARLLVAWRQFYVRRTQRTVLRALFRSMDVAFHAGLFPSDGLTGPSDAGLRLALWVSAFEVLFHAGWVNKSTVQAALAGSPWDYSKLTVSRYKLRVDRTKTRRGTLVEKIYEDLYNARNAFLHGNPVSARTLRFDRRDYCPSLVTHWLPSSTMERSWLFFSKGSQEVRTNTWPNTCRRSRRRDSIWTGARACRTCNRPS